MIAVRSLGTVPRAPLPDGHAYDLKFFDHETCRLECAENPFAAKLLPMSPDSYQYLLAYSFTSVLQTSPANFFGKHVRKLFHKGFPLRRERPSLRA